MKKAVVVLSGGMDSATLAYRLNAHHTIGELVAVTFDYGQRHRRELQYARLIAEHAYAEHVLVDLYALKYVLTGSALTDSRVAVPDGHYTDESMKATVVPNRNAIMLSVAWGIAVARGAEVVATAVHAGDHAIYPDCREDFIMAVERALQLGTDRPRMELYAPYLQHTKAEIAAEGQRLGVPWVDTWSCYRGEELHCGTCGTCTERREAFALAGIADPTMYAA